MVALIAAWSCQEENPDDNNSNNNTEQTGTSENNLPGTDESGQNLLFDTVDTSVYKYPKKGDTINPNLIIPDYDKMTLEALDTAAHTATLKFSGEVPQFYKGSVIVPVKDSNAYPMFILTSKTSGNTVKVTWRDAAIGEIIFNTSLGSGYTDTKADDGKKKKLDIVTGILNHIDAGFFFNFKGVTFKLNVDVDVEIGSPIAPSGMSINSPVKNMKAIFTGTANSGAEWGLEPTAGKSINYKKVLKEGVFHNTIIFWCYGIPIPVDFEVDLVAQVDFLLKIGAIKYSQEVDYTATLTMGGTMNFETGVYTPANSFDSKLTFSDPRVEWTKEIQASLEASIYPSLRTYVCKIQYVGLQLDIKPLVGKVDFYGQYKDGHFFHSFDTSIRTDVTFNAFIKNPKTRKYTYLLEDRPDLSITWANWHHPKKLTDTEKDKKINGSFNREDKLKVQVQDENWENALQAPVSSQQTCVEVEPFGTLPNPETDPDFYKNWEIDQPTTPNAIQARIKAMQPSGTEGWYSYGKSYAELDKDGNVELPLKVEVPAGQGYKYVVRLLDGKMDVIEEFEHEIDLAVKDYSIVQRITAPDGSMEPHCTVTDYGLNVVEDTDLPDGCKGHVEFHGGQVSGYMTVPGYGKIPVQAFFGSGTWLMRNHQMGPDGGLFTTSEGNDFVWWAYEKGLNNTTYGNHYSLVDFHGLPCTKVTGPEIGTLYYFQNIFLDWHDEDVTVKTISLQGVDGWSYQ